MPPPPITRKQESEKSNQKRFSKSQKLPETEKEITIEVDEQGLIKLANTIKEHFDTKQIQRYEDGKIHISDLTVCLRKALITVQNQDSIENNIYDYVNFMGGLDSERTLVDIMTDGQAVGGTDYQRDINFDEFTAHPDLIMNNVVYELKATNKNQPLILSDDALKSYINQVVYYMVLLDIEDGRILVRYRLPYFLEYMGKDDLDESVYKLRFHKDTNEFPFFQAKLHIAHQAPIRQEIKDGLINVIKPLWKAGDITKIPVLDNKKYNWRCGYCKVRNICDQIPDRQTDPYIRNIVLNKHIQNASNKVRRVGRKTTFSFKQS